MNELLNLKNQTYTFLGKNSFLKGDITFDGLTHIAGKVEGNIHIDGQHNLIIEPEGRIEGSLICHDLEIFGEFEGDLRSTGSIKIYPSAEVKGNISANNLIILPGAIVNMAAETKESAYNQQS